MFAISIFRTSKIWRREKFHKQKSNFWWDVYNITARGELTKHLRRISNQQSNSLEMVWCWMTYCISRNNELCSPARISWRRISSREISTWRSTTLGLCSVIQSTPANLLRMEKKWIKIKLKEDIGVARCQLSLRAAQLTSLFLGGDSFFYLVSSQFG